MSKCKLTLLTWKLTIYKYNFCFCNVVVCQKIVIGWLGMHLQTGFVQRKIQNIFFYVTELRYSPNSSYLPSIQVISFCIFMQKGNETILYLKIFVY